MKYRQLGKYGVKVSAVGLGSWLTYGHGIDNKTALKCHKTALDEGIIFFDTSDAYSKGEAEKVIGKILFKELDVRRQDVVLATKCYWPISKNPNDQGLSRKHIFESVH